MTRKQVLVIIAFWILIITGYATLKMIEIQNKNLENQFLKLQVELEEVRDNRIRLINEVCNGNGEIRDNILNCK